MQVFLPDDIFNIFQFICSKEKKFEGILEKYLRENEFKEKKKVLEFLEEQYDSWIEHSKTLPSSFNKKNNFPNY